MSVRPPLPLWPLPLLDADEDTTSGGPPPPLLCCRPARRRRVSRSRSALLRERDVPEAEAVPAEVDSESGSERPLSRLGAARLGGSPTHVSDTDRP